MGKNERFLIHEDAGPKGMNREILLLERKTKSSLSVRTLALREMDCCRGERNIDYIGVETSV